MVKKKKNHNVKYYFGEDCDEINGQRRANANSQDNHNNSWNEHIVKIIKTIEKENKNDLLMENMLDKRIRRKNKSVGLDIFEFKINKKRKLIQPKNYEIYQIFVVTIIGKGLFLVSSGIFLVLDNLKVRGTKQRDCEVLIISVPNYQNKKLFLMSKKSTS